MTRSLTHGSSFKAAPITGVGTCGKLETSANRASIEALVTYALQQELIPARPRLDEVFVQIDP